MRDKFVQICQKRPFDKFKNYVQFLSFGVMEYGRVFTSFNDCNTSNRNVIENLTVRERPIGSDHRNIPRNSHRSVRLLPCMCGRIRLAHRLSENPVLAICSYIVLFYYRKSGNFHCKNIFVANGSHKN